MSAKKFLKISNLKLVTFDITGTLLEPKLELYPEIAYQHGIRLLNPEKLAPSWKQHFLFWSNEHPNYGKYSGLGWKNWWKHVVVNVFKDQNPEVPDEKLHQIATTLIEQYSTKQGWHVLPGAVNILQYLNNQKIILGVISNFDKRLEPILISTGIRKYFSFIITSYDYGREKPDVILFEKALELVQQTRGEKITSLQALHIGDNLKLDYDGAKNAGWNAFLMDPNSGDKLKSIPEFERFKNLHELQKYFEVSIVNK
ncbi:rhythmically expressed gene 2 protein-like [Chelonus insularis]|uniref:rhythmically expressed gene 2 protein-like n=1 Tax=Chelonus insularis TaxID=460826 RepID=UPI001589A0E6|nr:rhythmically expressed gene 2 protein-like [Chelonus insularis]